MPSIHARPSTGTRIARGIREGISTGLTAYTQLKSMELQEKRLKMEEEKAERELEEQRLRALAAGTLFGDTTQALSDQAIALEEDQAVQSFVADPPKPMGGPSGALQAGVHVAEADRLKRKAAEAQRMASTMPPDLQRLYLRKQEMDLKKKALDYGHTNNARMAEQMISAYGGEELDEGEAGKLMSQLKRAHRLGEDPNPIAKELGKKMESLRDTRSRNRAWDDFDSKFIPPLLKRAEEITEHLGIQELKDADGFTLEERLHRAITRASEPDYRGQSYPMAAKREIQSIMGGYEARGLMADAMVFPEGTPPEEQRQARADVFLQRDLPHPTSQPALPGGPRRDFERLQHLEQEAVVQAIEDSLKSDSPEALEKALRHWNVDPSTMDPMALAQIANRWLLDRRNEIVSAVKGGGMTSAQGMKELMAAAKKTIPISGPEGQIELMNVAKDYAADVGFSFAAMSPKELAKLTADSAPIASPSYAARTLDAPRSASRRAPAARQVQPRPEEPPKPPSQKQVKAAWERFPKPMQELERLGYTGPPEMAANYVRERLKMARSPASKRNLQLLLVRLSG
jgi:hypothetical protein